MLQWNKGIYLGGSLTYLQGLIVSFSESAASLALPALCIRGRARCNI